MSRSTRLLSIVLHRFRLEATREGLSRREIAKELRQLREQGSEFAREELRRQYA